MSDLVNKICYMVNEEKFPGVENLTTRNVYRSLGDSESRERIGIGFMDKSGIESDNIDHRFPYYVIVYVLQGKGTYIDRHRQHYPLYPGCFFQRIPDELHSNLIEPRSCWKECFIDLGREIFTAYRTMRIIRDDFRVGFMPSILLLAERLWELQQRLRAADEYELQRLLPEVLAMVTETHQQQWHNDRTAMRRMLELACCRLGQDLGQRFDLAEFCRRQGWGYESFRKKFKEEMGISPGQYRIRRRLDVACEMLNQQDLSIGEIAFRLGYRSQYEFSSQFKEYTGIPPLRFRIGGGKAISPSQHQC